MLKKKWVLPAVLGFSLLGGSLAFANEAYPVNHPKVQKQVRSHGFLSAEQKEAMHVMRKNLHDQMIPLMKEKIALKMQLKGRIATPQTQWNDLSRLMSQINENNAKITNLIAQTKLASFQQFGVMIPLKHHHKHHACNFCKK